MIELTKLSRQHFVLNEEQIQFIEFIPETKITMMNGEFLLVREDEAEVMRRIVAFRQKILPTAYYNRFIVQGTAASRVLNRIVVKAVRMGAYWPDDQCLGLARPLCSLSANLSFTAFDLCR